MKKTLICLVACVLMGASTLFAGEPVVTAGENPTKSFTFKQLKEKYGENLIIHSGTYQDDDVIQIKDDAAGPGDCHGRQCKKVIAQESKQYQDEANSCCCSFAVGIICCEQGLTVEYLILFEPNQPCTP